MNGGGDGAWMIGICVNGRGSARFCGAEPRRADMGRYMGDAKQLATGALSGGDGGTISELCNSTLMTRDDVKGGRELKRWGRVNGAVM